MAIQIFRLRGVAVDEAEDIRDLLAENHLEFYETPGGNWGISMPALWLVNDDDKASAEALIESYQKARFTRARAEYDQLKREGKQPTLLSTFKESPAQFIFYFVGIVALIYLTTMPFMDAGK